MENRYNITGKDGSYCESKDKKDLECLRKFNPIFKGRHIKNSLQGWYDIILLNVIYPPACFDRMDFINHNRRVFKNWSKEEIQGQLSERLKNEINLYMKLIKQKGFKQ